MSTLYIHQPNPVWSSLVDIGDDLVLVVTENTLKHNKMYDLGELNALYNRAKRGSLERDERGIYGEAERVKAQNKIIDHRIRKCAEIIEPMRVKDGGVIARDGSDDRYCNSLWADDPLRKEEGILLEFDGTNFDGLLWRVKVGVYAESIAEARWDDIEGIKTLIQRLLDPESCLVEYSLIKGAH